MARRFNHNRFGRGGSRGGGDDDEDLSYEAFQEVSGRMCRDICLGRWNTDAEADWEDAVSLPPRGTVQGVENQGEEETVKKNEDGVTCGSEDKAVNSSFPVIPEESAIKKVFECPVCYETVLPPITLCNGGHSVCHCCRKSLPFPRCPVCRGDFTQVRNHLAEDFLEMCKVKCRFTEAGCGVVLNGRELAIHQDERCNFRPILCFLCKKEVAYSTFLGHLETEENLESYQADKFFTGFYISDLLESVPFITAYWEPIWTQSFGQNFFCFLQKRRSDSLWWIWLGIYAPPDISEEFLYSIAINYEDKKIPMEFQIDNAEKKQMHLKVNSVRDTPDQVLDSGRCISFLDSELTSYIVDGKINVAVEIYKMSKGESSQSQNESEEEM